MNYKLSLKKISLLMIISINLVSCKFSHKVESNNETIIIDNMTFSKERPFIKSELTIGRRVCAALKSKREFFQTLYDRQEQFRFFGTVLDCKGVSNLDSLFIASIANNSSLEYSAIFPRDNYFRDILTDHSGALNDICLNLQSTDNVLNTVKMGSVRYTVSFLIADNFDRVDTLKEINNSAGGYAPTGAESVSVITQSNQAATKFFGVEKERTRYTNCDGRLVPTMKQSWKEAVTRF